MTTTARKVKGKRIGPRKPRKKALQPSDAPPQMPNGSLFMRLPPEIRNMIYQLAIKDYHKVMMGRNNLFSNTIRIKGHKILTGSRTKKYCHVDLEDKIPVGPVKARPLYYSLSKLKIFAHPHELRGVSEILDGISTSLEPIPGTQWPIKELWISLVGLKWENVNLLLALAQMCMKYPIGVDHRGQSLGYLIEDLQKLAQRGYQEEWADEWLELQFKAWLDKLPGSQQHRERGPRRWSGTINESYLQKRWSKMTRCEELPGDSYGLKEEDEADGDFNGSRRNVPASDRKLRSMSQGRRT
ncbi:hypothetical protein BST61_g2022 [Cercospora zeina]